MIRAVRSLRARLTVAGALAIYLPVLLVFVITSVTKSEITELDADGGWTAERSMVEPSNWTAVTVVGLGPIAVVLAWWWSGRAVRPLERIRSAAEHIEASDLSLRIGLSNGPSETVALAASFDAMLDRLEHAAQVQRRLIEETSHELRTPLSVLITNAEVLLQHPSPDLALYREGLERTRSSAGRMRETISELLIDARGRAREIDRRPVDLVALARGVLDDFAAPAAAAAVALSGPGGGPVACAVDEATVRRAIANLVDNAVKHAPAGSAVEVEVERSPTGAEVTVTDHGAGIPEDERERVFERFWRGGDAPGTGLGLPIARQIAEAHGGALTVEVPGPVGDGCRFRLGIPNPRSKGPENGRRPME